MDYQTLPELTQLHVLEGVMQMLFHGVLLIVSVAVGGVICLVLSTLGSFRRSTPGIASSVREQRQRRWRVRTDRQGAPNPSQTRITAASVLREF
jgi:hypothetical protein